tara:strand:- start:59 stop:271 length:213 start_codon:yes stop_codon:yes gene_type:complete
MKDSLICNFSLVHAKLEVVVEELNESKRKEENEKKITHLSQVCEGFAEVLQEGGDRHVLLKEVTSITCEI